MPDYLYMLNRRRIAVVADLTVESAASVCETWLFVDSTAGPITLTLPDVALSDCRALLVIHSVPTSLLTIVPPGAVTIQGAPNLQLAGDGTIRSVNVISDGIGYFIG